MTQVQEFPVTLNAALPIPPQSAHAALLRALDTMKQNRGSVCLTLRLEELQLPVTATISVPVHVCTDTSNAEQIQITIEALEQSTLFPRFRGTIWAVNAPSSGCELVMNGFYAVPMGWIGRTIDSTLLQGSAVASLTQFLRRIADDIEQTVKRDEIAHARAVLHQHV